jgi:hypothetical protein
MLAEVVSMVVLVVFITPVFGVLLGAGIVLLGEWISGCFNQKRKQRGEES